MNTAVRHSFSTGKLHQQKGNVRLGMRNIAAVWAAWLWSPACFSQAPQDGESAPQNVQRSWEASAHGVHFSMTQIYPEQARAFYVNRGFSLQQIEPYASSCVFMTVLRNDNAPGAIHFISKDWPIVADNSRHSLVTVDEWVERLTTAGAKRSAQVAFRWAQFPPEQTYEPGGDWNQGMFSIGLPLATRFDATALWDLDGRTFAATLKGVECAE